jgi:hypothetical protein
MNHNPHCNQLAQQFNASANGPLPPGFGRFLSYQMDLIMETKLPETACADADTYWKVRSTTRTIQRAIVEDCNGVWRDPETGKVSLSRANIDAVYGKEEQRFQEDRQKMCKAS